MIYLRDKTNKYEEVKSQLLNDDNIEKVVIDTAREKITITPRQDLNYFWMEEPLKNFKNNGIIKIDNKSFKIVKYLKNMDKVFELVIEEY